MFAAFGYLQGNTLQSILGTPFASCLNVSHFTNEADKRAE